MTDDSPPTGSSFDRDGRDDAAGSGGAGTDDRDGDDGSDPAAERDPDDGDAGDTFGVGVHVTESELRFVVRVPSDIDSGWTDPDAFQQLVQEVVWDRLDRESTLRAVAATTLPGESATLGTVTLRPDGTVVDASLRPPDPEN